MNKKRIRRTAQYKASTTILECTYMKEIRTRRTAQSKTSITISGLTYEEYNNKEKQLSEKLAQLS